MKVSINANAPIGVFDSGVGGLTVVRKLADLLPNERVIYFGDTARVPYGNKSPETIRLYARQITDYLLSRGVKLIIIACNTASSVALELVRERSTVPVIGMIRPGAQAAVNASSTGRIGVIGTYATILSDAYTQTITEILPSAHILSRACPLFVPLAEEGWNDTPVAHMIAEEYLSPLRDASIDTLVLGCTHYPILSSVIRKTMHGIRLIDSGEEAAREAQVLLTALNLVANSNNEKSDKLPQIECVVTDKPTTFSTVAEHFLGYELQSVEQISPDDLR